MNKEDAMSLWTSALAAAGVSPADTRVNIGLGVPFPFDDGQMGFGAIVTPGNSPIRFGFMCGAADIAHYIPLWARAVAISLKTGADVQQAYFEALG